LRRRFGAAAALGSASGDAIIGVEREFVIVARRAAAEGRFYSVA
jgi:hypothetical protein